MSVICQNFVQNAWRKDLCSNCFKSEADHSDCGYHGTRDVARRYVPQAAPLYQSRGLSMNVHWRPLLPEPVSKIQERIACRDFGSQTSILQKTQKGILKDQVPSRKTRRTSVGFAPEEPLVIGYGGRDYDSDDSPWEMGSDDGSINLELLDCTDEDRTITKLTKNNTEFNSVNENLIANSQNELPTVNQDVLNNRNQPFTNGGHTTNYKSTTVNQSDNRPESYYYFSAKNEPPKSYLPKLSDHTTYLADCKEMSLIAKDIPGIINNIQNNNVSCQNVDNLNKMNRMNSTEYISKTNPETECQNRNSSRYLLITRVQDSCSSDSDYSTSKQTNGESSTDTESFHDAEETLISPCSSFLHGSSIVNSESTRCYTSKPFETSSVSSADTSTFSDDSDSQKPQENNQSNKLRNNQSKTTVTPISGKTAVKSLTQNKYKATPVKFKDESIVHHNSNCAPQSIPLKSESMNHNDINDTSTFLGQTVGIAEPRKAEMPSGNKMQLNISQKALTTNSDEINKQYQHETVMNNKNISNTKAAITRENSKISIETSSNEPKTANDVTSKLTAKALPSVADSRHQAKPAADNNGTVQRINVLGENVSSNDIKQESRVHQDLGKSNSDEVHHEDSKKWTVEADEWKSVQRTPQSTPSVCSTTTTDTEDHQDTTQHNIYTPESNGSSARSSPNSKSNRESKLAALALELEKVRCDASGKESKQQDARYSTPRAKTSSKEDNTRVSKSESSKYPSIRRGRSLVSPNQTPKSSLPDLLPETKVKKGRFSLKKLLKRGKDSETLVINSPSEYNPKAWKRQTFDRSRLSLEIIHPMDLTTDPNTSADSTPTEDGRASIFSNPAGRHHAKSGTTRARSLSALPQLGSCVSESSDPEGSGLRKENVSTLDRPRMDLPRKAGTVAERSKKYKAPRRTPSFSELRSASSGRSTGSGAPSERPPKPPPPPRGKSLPPPQPPKTPPPLPQEKPAAATAPSRPPPPKIQEENESSSCSGQSQDIGDYANLGDIRLHIIPKKPQRPSAVSFARDTLETPAAQGPSPDNTYETLEAQDEEDHYTYVDEMEGKGRSCQRAVAENGRIQISVTCSDKRQPDPSSSGPRASVILKKPWMNLHASYAAIAAANYESLAELITTAISEGLEKFQKTASTLKWNDFELESNDAIQVLDDKLVYNAVYKSHPKTKVTLMVTTQRQHTTQSSNRNPYRPPVLVAFSDVLPKQVASMVDSKYLNYNATQKAMVYVLQRSKTTTVNQFAQDSASFHTNQHVHLRNACFVLLQLIHTLKSLQAEGIEEIDYDLSRILLLHTDVDKPPILVLLPGDKVYLTMTDFYKADVATRKTTLCQTTLQLLFQLLQIKAPNELSSCIVNGEVLASAVAHTFGVISKILSEEKASSLTQAKGLLEYMLWGPVDIKTAATDEDIDIILQRWLDLQRAQMVKSLISNLHHKISSHTGFHVYEEYQLIFLLQATVKSLKDIISKL